MDSTVSYLMEMKKDFILKISEENRQITPIGGKVEDVSVLNDLETSIRQPLIAEPVKSAALTPSLLSTMFPPFSRLQCADNVRTDGVARSSSLYGVISCVSKEDLVYSPVSPTGVITAISNGKVRLSVLDAETGIVEDQSYEESEVRVQKYRLLFHLDDVQHLRGIVGRLCVALLQLWSREAMISLLYLMQPRLDVIDSCKMNSYDIVRLMKFIYLTQKTSQSWTSTFHETMTLESCQFKLLQLAIRQIVSTSPRALTLIQAFMDGTWDDTDNNKVTLYVPPEDERLSMESASLRQLTLSSISIGNFTNNCVYVSSLHPSFPKTKYSDKITIPGAAGLRIIFDRQCYLDPTNASLSFYQDEAMNQSIARFSGTADAFCSFTVRGNTVRFTYESNVSTGDQWGYGFMVQPFENVNWSCDADVLSSRCFDWNCYAYDLLIDISKSYKFDKDDFFNRTLNNLVLYLQTSGMSFKMRVVELLSRLITSKQITVTAHPDVSGMMTVVLRYCENIDRNTIVPSQLPLLLDFLLTYTLKAEIDAASVKEKRADPIAPWVENVPEVKKDSLLEQLTSVHLLTRCIYYRAPIPAKYLRVIMEATGLEWTEPNYRRTVEAMRSFSPLMDEDLLTAFEIFAQQSKSSLLDADASTYALTDDDKARYYALRDVDPLHLRLRIALLQFYNRQLQPCMHLIELMNASGKDERTLGSLITSISLYVFPAIKENVLEMSIKQTEYSGQAAYPIVELDNRRIFTELERSGDDMDNDSHSAINSECMFAQFCRQMQRFPVSVLRAKLDSKDRLVAIKYKGEQGLDWGGLYRDAVERCVEDLFSDHIDLFIPCPNAMNDQETEERFIPNPRYRDSSEALEMYRFVGNLIGVSLRTKHLLSFELSPQIWKTIVGDEVTEEDIKAVDSGLISTLQQVREYSESDGVDEFPFVFDMVFAVLDSAGNEVELLPSGSQIAVTFHNRLKFCKMALEARINEARQAAEAIAAGVYALVPQRALTLFTWEQLERTVKGVPEISVELLKKHTVYIGWTESHPVVKQFWNVMEGLTDKDRSQFLRFTWGRSKLPKSESWPRPFKLTYKNAGDYMLPVAHTCFFQLELPQYSSEQIMRERLLVAIHYGSSGEFIMQ